MSLDALLTLVFILFFVVGPLLRRFTGQQQQPPGRPGRPPAQPTGGTPGEGEGPLARRLEEARRRVLEALGEEETRGGVAPAPPTRSSTAAIPSSSRTLDWQQAAKPVRPFIERQGVRTAARPSAAKPAEGGALPPVRRHPSTQTAKLRPGRLPALDERGIVNGVIWHEILSEPVSRRGIRRQSSRLRSR
jgi:hypothetical protein